MRAARILPGLTHDHRHTPARVAPTPLQPRTDLAEPVDHAPPGQGQHRLARRGRGLEFVHFLSAHLGSLETRAAIIMPAQLAALIALWPQFYTFEEDVPRALVWIA